MIRDGVIAEVGTTRRVENLAEARNATEINAAGRVVMPGFVDSHTHVAFPPPGASDAEKQCAARTVCTETGRRLASRVLTSLESMARHGTTTVEVKSGCDFDDRAELKVLRCSPACGAIRSTSHPHFSFAFPIVPAIFRVRSIR